MNTRTFKTVSAKDFYDPERCEYVFRFTPLDDTPGGGNLGRIQWLVELVPGSKTRGQGIRPIKKIYVWANQTNDTRYKGIIFEIEANSECVTTSVLKRDAYAPWRIFFCEMHKGNVVMDAYPENEHNELVIGVMSGLSTEIRFQPITRK